MHETQTPWWQRTGVRNNLKGLAFISPWLLGYLAFTLYPIFASGYYSLTRYDVIRSPRFIGLENYQEALEEEYLPGSMWVTAKFVLASVVIEFVIGKMAILVSSRKNIITGKIPISKMVGGFFGKLGNLLDNCFGLGNLKWIWRRITNDLS